HLHGSPRVLQWPSAQFCQSATCHSFPDECELVMGILLTEQLARSLVMPDCRSEAAAVKAILEHLCDLAVSRRGKLLFPKRQCYAFANGSSGLDKEERERRNPESSERLHDILLFNTFVKAGNFYLQPFWAELPADGMFRQ